MRSEGVGIRRSPARLRLERLRPIDVPILPQDFPNTRRTETENRMSTIRRQHRFATVPEELLFDATISPGARCLYAILDRHADGDGRMWPGMRRLAGLLGVTEETARKFRGELEANGWLLNDGQPNGTEGFKSNRYVLVQVRDTTNFPVTGKTRDGKNRGRLLNESQALNESQGETLLSPVGDGGTGNAQEASRARSGEQSLSPARPDGESAPSQAGGGEASKLAKVRNPAWDALADIEGHGGNPSPLAAGGIGRALKAIRGMMPGAELDAVAAEIRRRAGNWASHFEGATITAMALAKWWARMEAPKTAVPKPGGWSKFAKERDAAMQGDWSREFEETVEHGKTV